MERSHSDYHYIIFSMPSVQRFKFQNDQIVDYRRYFIRASSRLQLSTTEVARVLKIITNVTNVNDHE